MSIELDLTIEYFIETITNFVRKAFNIKQILNERKITKKLEHQPVFDSLTKFQTEQEYQYKTKGIDHYKK